MARQNLNNGDPLLSFRTKLNDNFTELYSIINKVDLTKVVFYEEFTGNGIANTFTLNGTIGNGTFSQGTWNNANILNTSPSNVTNSNLKPIYDSTNVFSRNKITVSNITGALVTLSHIPRNTEVFRVYYWYNLTSSDLLTNYEKDDIVTDQESQTPMIAEEVPYDNSSSGLVNTNLQTAIDEIQTNNPSINFDSALGALPAHSEGLVFYDNTKKAVSYYNEEADITVNIGQEHLIPVYNNSGSTITNGTVVYPSGFDAGTGLPTIDIADASERDKCRLVGMVTHDIENGTRGYVTRLGEVNGIDTSGLTGVVYLTSDGTGGITNTRPNDGSYEVIIGAVAEQDAVTGSIVVDVNVSQLTVEVTDTNGFPPDQRTATTISFVDGTRTFTIAPTGTDFHFYELGDKYLKTASDSVVIDGVTGDHIIYYDSGVLSSLANPSGLQINDIILNKCIVAYIYWNSISASSIIVQDERHGISMSPETHSYLHQRFGAFYVSGLALNDFVIGLGSLDSHAQFSVSTGVIKDEDISHTISAIASTTGLRYMYRSGASGDWYDGTNAGFSFPVGATPLPQYNEFTGATWQLTEIGSGDYMNLHIFTNGDIDGKPFVLLGTSSYTNASTANAGQADELTAILGNLPAPEFVLIGSVIIEGKTSFTNSVQARVVENDNGDNYTNWTLTEVSSGATPANHNVLAGLQLANTGVTFGHIDDQVQTIVGAKTFSDPLRVFGVGAATQGLLHLRSTNGNPDYMSFTEEGANDLGAIGFDAGTTVMNFKLGTTTGTTKFSIDSDNVNIPTGSSYNINGVSLNTGGTLSNVAYLDQVNVFTDTLVKDSGTALRLGSLNATGGAGGGYINISYPTDTFGSIDRALFQSDATGNKGTGFAVVPAGIGTSTLVGEILIAGTNFTADSANYTALINRTTQTNHQIMTLGVGAPDPQQLDIGTWKTSFDPFISIRYSENDVSIVKNTSISGGLRIGSQGAVASGYAIDARDDIRIVGADGQQIIDFNALDTTNIFRIQVSGTGHADDDIQLGRDDGGNEVLIPGVVSIGDNPGTTSQRQLLMYQNSASAQLTQYANSNTGYTSSSSGFVTGITSAGQGYLWHFANQPIIFGVNNTTALTIANTGDATFANDVFLQGALIEYPLTITAGTYNNLNVAGVNIVYCNTNAGDIIINGTSGGTSQQSIKFVKVDTANSLIFNHQNASGVQQLRTYSGSNLTYGQYRGSQFTYNGQYWYQTII